MVYGGKSRPKYGRWSPYNNAVFSVGLLFIIPSFSDNMFGIIFVKNSCLYYDLIEASQEQDEAITQAEALDRPVALCLPLKRVVGQTNKPLVVKRIHCCTAVYLTVPVVAKFNRQIQRGDSMQHVVMTNQLRTWGRKPRLVGVIRKNSYKGSEMSSGMKRGNKRRYGRAGPSTADTNGRRIVGRRSSKFGALAMSSEASTIRVVRYSTVDAVVSYTSDFNWP
ncbi:hypothetical protein TNCV_2994381 [Trichonephila clavipes]|nr:hypothetical protein TNCV_2994381 [Trichonephila clavipes]